MIKKGEKREKMARDYKKQLMEEYKARQEKIKERRL
jgi:hypothetical protein